MEAAATLSVSTFTQSRLHHSPFRPLPQGSPSCCLSRSTGLVDDYIGYDFFDDHGDPYDDGSHGTHVAGIIGAIGNNSAGTVGVAPNVRLLPCRFLSPLGFGQVAHAIACLDYVIAQGAHVVVNSYQFSEYSSSFREAVAVAEEAGVLLVAAAGNSAVDLDQQPMYPAAFDAQNVVSVAACEGVKCSQLALYSSFGSRAVDLAAPGSSVLSTVPGGYDRLSGTSMAAPMVAGGLVELEVGWWGWFAGS